MEKITVNLGERSYPIYIGDQILRTVDMGAYVGGERVLIVTNKTVAPLYLDSTAHLFNEFRCDSMVLADGEQYKNIETLNSIFDVLLEKRFDRQSTLIALGGGVVGDITGFAAACYQRGVNFIQLPTTLLAQVDSSVGGKTGVNHALGKNMIGAFHQPSCVIADTSTLKTLDDRQLYAGIAEVIKYGLIRDRDFFEWLEAHIEKLTKRDTDALNYVIRRCCINKAEVVSQDEKESGIRALLNFGHTFGHAIEVGLGYGNWLHGEAVSAGMVLAAEMSVRLGWLDKDELDRIKDLLQMSNLPIQPPAEIHVSQFLQYMAVDKKVMKGKKRLVLLKSIGKALVTDDYDESVLYETINSFKS